MIALFRWEIEPELRHPADALRARLMPSVSLLSVGGFVGTLVGIVVGIVATVVVSHYYFRRSTRKSLKMYLILNSRVFDGIEPGVRRELHFSFRGDEVAELQHIEFLIANDGERAISNLIEPLRISLPEGVRILDASILYRSPETLQAVVDGGSPAAVPAALIVAFPLLNKGEFFAVKLLLSGRVQLDALAATLLADDLPRSIKAEWLPPTARRDAGRRVEWSAVATGFFFILLAAGLAHSLYTLRTLRPELFPYPWHPFQPTWHVAPLAVTAATCLLLALVGVILSTFVALEGLLTRRGRLSLPTELRRRRGPFLLAHHEVVFTEGETIATDKSGAVKRPG